MTTVIERLKADEWSSLGKYASGRADQISTILEHFGNELPDHVKEWLYNSRTVAREEASVCYQNALDIYNKESETK